MTRDRFHRRGFLVAVGATVAGCLGDGDDDGRDVERNGTDDGSDANRSGDGDPSTSLDCGRLTERYVRHDPGASPFVFTAEIPETDDVYAVAKKYREMQIEKDVGDYKVELRLRQAGPFTELPEHYKPEAEGEPVTSITFEGSTMPVRKHTIPDRPQYYVGVPVPGRDDAYATVVTALEIKGPADATAELCREEGNAVQLHAITSIEPNPDHSLTGEPAPPPSASE